MKTEYDGRKTNEDISSTDAARAHRLDRCPWWGDVVAAPALGGRVRIQDGPQHTRGASVPQASAGGIRAHRQGNRRAHDAQCLSQQPARRRQRPPVAGAQRRDRDLPARRADPCVDPAAHRHQRHGLRLRELRQGLADDGRRPRQIRARPDHRQGRPGADGPHLGSRLPPDHQQREADQVRRRPRRHEAARAGRTGAGLAVQGARHSSGQHAVRRGLYLAADQGRRRPGKPDVDHRRRQVLRGAEVLLASQTMSGTATGSASTRLRGTACPTTSRRSSPRPSTKARLPSAPSSRR